MVVLVVKNPLASARDVGDPVRFLGWEDPLEEEMATHSNILVWRVSWTEEPGRLQSMGRKESDTDERLRAHTHPQGVGCLDTL